MKKLILAGIIMTTISYILAAHTERVHARVDETLARTELLIQEVDKKLNEGGQNDN